MARASTSVTALLPSSLTPRWTPRTTTTCTREPGSSTPITRARKGTTSRTTSPVTCFVRATSGHLQTALCVSKVYFLIHKLYTRHVSTLYNLMIVVGMICIYSDFHIFQSCRYIFSPYTSNFFSMHYFNLGRCVSVAGHFVVT